MGGHRMSHMHGICVVVFHCARRQLTTADLCRRYPLQVGPDLGYLIPHGDRTLTPVGY
jgi:hypothetical protein